MTTTDVNSVSLSRAEIIEPPASEVRNLLGSTEASFTLECVPCGHDETLQANSEWAAGKSFYLGGWRVIENEAWCEECINSAGTSSESV